MAYHAHDITFPMTEYGTCEKASRVVKNANYTHLLHYNSKINCISRNTNKHTLMIKVARLNGHNQAAFQNVHKRSEGEK
jgi:hypothetical protein